VIQTFFQLIQAKMNVICTFTQLIRAFFGLIHTFSNNGKLLGNQGFLTIERD
jgi:hypothetical protein